MYKQIKDNLKSIDEIMINIWDEYFDIICETIKLQLKINNAEAKLFAVYLKETSQIDNYLY